jgi:hypothetical protein
MLRIIWTFIIDNWGKITAIALAASGILIFLKNYHHLINLRLQNKKLKQERIDPFIGSHLYNLSDFKINFSTIAQNSLKSFNIDKSYLIELISTEFHFHPIFTSIDYNSLPLPLKDKNFVFLTKLNNELTIEDVNQTVPQIHDIYINWSTLSGQYFSAYRLPFRKNHLELINESSYNKADNIVTKLIEDIHKYYFVVLTNQKFIDTDILYFHRSKFFMADKLIQAHKHYEEYMQSNDIKLLGQIAIDFDSIISITHKILLQYFPKENKLIDESKPY